MPGSSGQLESEFVKRKIVRRSIVTHLFTLAQPSWPDASRVSQPASASAPQPARASPLRQAWLAVVSRGLGATRPLNRCLATACVALATCAGISAHAQYATPPTWSP
jgi:hypothetical protein